MKKPSKKQEKRYDAVIKNFQKWVTKDPEKFYKALEKNAKKLLGRKHL